MKFDSKSYLYGVYCNVFKSFNDSDELFNDMTEILGDFMIYPGSIKEFNDDKTRERGIEFIPTIMDADINIEKYRLNVLGRYNIEAKNAELKNEHGYAHASYAGIHGMTLQAGVSIFVVNLKRVLRLKNEKEGK